VSAKNAKRDRKLLKELDLLKPILKRAYLELEEDDQLYITWSRIAAHFRLHIPDVPAEKLLPSQLESTTKEYHLQLKETGAIRR
jgi:hypothetical protein